MESNIHENKKQGIIDLNLNSVNIESKSFFESLNNIRETINGISKLVGSNVINSSNTISKMLETVSTIMKSFVFDESYFENVFHNLHDTITDIVQVLSVPGLNEAEKQRLIDSYTNWGKLGWTINPCDDFENLFDICPSDPLVANKMALEKCRKTEDLICHILNQKRVKKSDFEEAIANFHEKEYKSCALIMFSLIDGKLIRFSGRSKEGKCNRPSGARAIEVIKKKLGTEYEKETLFMALFCVNLFACIEKMFEPGKDFKTQPDIINRNFLCHGMLTKKVSRKDCIQLFLLYYNILELSDLIYDK